MEFSIPNFGSYQLILIGVIFLLISFIFLRKYFKAFLIYDLGDSILSFVDEPFGGVAMLDWGDWIMAFFIFTKYKKIVGVAIAILLAIEAGMFIPGLDYVTNFIPAVSIALLFFDKSRPAQKQEKKLEKDISIAEQVGIKVSKEKRVLDDVKKLIKKANPVGALKKLKSEKPVKEVSSKLRGYVDDLISDTNNIFQYISSQNIQPPQELINMLQEAINEAGQLLQEAQAAEEKEDFETEINSAANANNIIRAGAQQFYDAFQQYQNESQQ